MGHLWVKPTIRWREERGKGRHGSDGASKHRVMRGFYRKRQSQEENGGKKRAGDLSREIKNFIMTDSLVRKLRYND